MRSHNHFRFLPRMKCFSLQLSTASFSLSFSFKSLPWSLHREQHKPPNLVTCFPISPTDTWHQLDLYLRCRAEKNILIRKKQKQNLHLKDLFLCSAFTFTNSVVIVRFYMCSQFGSKNTVATLAASTSTLFGSPGAQFLKTLNKETENVANR